MKVSLRTKIILPVTVIFVVFMIAGYLAVDSTVSHLVRGQEKAAIHFADEAVANKATQKMASIYKDIQRIARKNLAEASLFSQTPEVQKAYALALSGNIDDPRDAKAEEARQLLRRDLAPAIAGYESATGTKSFQLHFHLPNGRSLVRLWRQGWQTVENGQKVDISDDISSFRKTVMEINQGDHKPITGIEVGRGGFAIRGIVSVVGPQGKHLGSCEVISPFADLLKVAAAAGDAQMAVYMNASLLPIATKLQNPQKYPVLDGKYVLTASTDRKVTDAVVTTQLLDTGEAGGVKKNLGDQYLTSFPIRDYSGKVVGGMVVVYNTAETATLKAQMKQDAEASLAGLKNGIGGGALLFLVVISAIIFFVVRQVTRPLAKVVDLTEAVARGDLSHHVAYHGDDEVGDLTKALDRMMNGLKAKASIAETIAGGDFTVDVPLASDADVMGHAFRQMAGGLSTALTEVRTASNQIASGSAQVSDSSQALSQGATEQASSLEEISASMNQLAAQTKQNADNATQANQLALQARGGAENGNAQMQQMVAAMDEISASSQNISKIIKVIDEIAFQTNLLALNAAVEAARAGVHGKGFAVVAEEVRNLAARSAKAAKETAELIEGSVVKTQNGSQIAGRTAKALAEIVTDVTKVTDLVAEIAAASSEQAQGIAQVNQGVAQIDQVTQQNTANAEESAAASEELSSQAAQLRQLLTRFRLNVGSPPLAQEPLTASAGKPKTRPSASGWSQLPAAATSGSDAGEVMIALDDDDFGRY